MKTYTQQELKEILEQHELWWNDHTKGQRANLSGATLSGVYLSGANLNRADLSRADLSRANLSRADLSRANLSRANLSGANLSGANLGGAYLSRANLSGATLSGVYLSGANLSGAYLSGANLSGADLSGANLRGANLSGAYLSGATLIGATLSGADLIGAYLSKKEWASLRDKFSIVTQDTKYVYKKLQNNIIAHLEIPKKAKRSNAFSRKCRAEYVKVLKLVDSDGNEIKEGFALYNRQFKYTKGRIIKPDSFDENWYNECGNGIHFFLTESEAKEFNL